MFGLWNSHAAPPRIAQTAGTSTTTKRSGVPFDAPQWEWKCGFYPASHRGVSAEGIAATFDQARADFEQAWREMQPEIGESDYQEHRLQRARTAWKYAMHDAGAKLPTQLASGRSKCFCGAELTAESISDHVLAAHMDMR